MKNSETYGLALEGGGAKGAFHMGAVKAFLEQGYKFDAVAGTSIGALNGAIIAQGDFELGYKWWQQMDTALLFDIEKAHIENYMNKHVSYATIKSLIAIARDIISSRGLDTEKIRELLGDIIDEDKIRKSKTELGIVTVSVSDFKPLELFKEDIPSGKLLDYLMASANFPAFKLKPLDGKYYIDGGFYDNCPVNLLGRKGYKNVIAIRTLGIGRNRKVDSNIDVLNVMPSKDLGKILVFDKNTIEENLKMGYCDAMRTLKNLRGNTYYINSNNDDSKVLARIINISDEDIELLAKINGNGDQPPKRLLFEKILPELADITGMKPDAQYQDIIIGILEHAAESFGVYKYEVYTLREFIKEIKKAESGQEKQTKEPAPVLALRKQRRSQLVDKAVDIVLKNVKL